jgi:hypothetical protein
MSKSPSYKQALNEYQNALRTYDSKDFSSVVSEVVKKHKESKGATASKGVVVLTEEIMREVVSTLHNQFGAK